MLLQKLRAAVKPLRLKAEKYFCLLGFALITFKAPYNLVSIDYVNQNNNLCAKS